MDVMTYVNSFYWHFESNIEICDPFFDYICDIGKIGTAMLDFSKNEALRMPLEVVFFDFMKEYTLMNKPSKWHYCTMICSPMFHTLVSI